MESLSNYTKEGSGWAVEEVEGMQVSMARYVPIRGGSYVPLPTWIERKKAIVNVKNDDNRCFMWAIRSALYPVGKDPCRPSKYPSDDLEWDGVEFPMQLIDILIFEKENDLAINVYGARDQTIVPLVFSKSYGERIHLFYHGGHYSWIKHLSRLFYRHTKHKGKKYFCDCCLLSFTSLKALKSHDEICRGVEEVAQRIQMPTQKELSYEDHRRQTEVPYVIYVDFEAIITKEDQKNGATKRLGLHEICSYGYIVVRHDGKADPPVIYRGKNAANKFLVALQDEEEVIRDKLRCKKKVAFTKESQAAYAKAKICHVCDRDLLQYGRQAKKAWDEDGKYLGEALFKCGTYAKKGEKAGKPSTHCIHCHKRFVEDFYMDKVLDYCPLTGAYIGAAHWRCRTRVNPDMEIPVFFHNLRGYDSHLLLQGTDGSDVKCIPNNKERYMSVTVGKLKFLDSQQFMADSLANLVKYNTNFPISSKYGAERKGVYPYEYMDSWERFQESLPSKDCFYSTLNESGIKDEEYQHALDVWQKHDCQTMGDYHDIYLRSDVVLLADVFQSFRKMAMEYYGLDPANFYTAPGLSWSALLKKTNAQLDLLYDMYRFMEDGIRGGVCGPNRRYAKANNPTVEYDLEKPTTYIFYLDANNLYGWAMSQYLPVRDFEWDDIKPIDFYMQVDKEANKGYVLEVDLEYPEHLHDAHDEFPLAPEAIKIPFKQLSPLQREMCTGYKP
ncbi:uncharacterized protein LOC116294670 [Actinia tenebrosa]|uniref:DNA-directed DNA polymerase n=1 Tax=Actinia tenebrosa TaxID=6105 RepID=A0A6P8HZZ2_ACTTE|nr:uncharacterized protein LOC116294670 [Actinia tenebrosa]